MNTIFVEGLGDLERRSVLLLASPVDRGNMNMLAISNDWLWGDLLYDVVGAVAAAADGNPFDTVGVSKEDFISIDLWKRWSDEKSFPAAATNSGVPRSPCHHSR